jgi:antitoxin (DNA-binding transcriptional repressor) of toxin-antitoxin stability system
MGIQIAHLFRYKRVNARLRAASLARTWPHVAIIDSVASTGIRKLKDNLSRYIRRIEAGERIAITAHGRIVAELVPPAARTKGAPSRFDELVVSGVIRPPLEAGDPTEGWPDIRLPAGTAAELIDAGRGET